MKRCYIRDEVVQMVESYQKRLGLSNFSEAVNSLLVVNSNQQPTNNQPTNQQPAKSSAIDDLDGLF